MRQVLFAGVMAALITGTVLAAPALAGAKEDMMAARQGRRATT